MTRTIRIYRLSSFGTSRGGVQWWIYYEGSHTPLITFNEWIASLADRSIALQRPVTVATMDTKYGPKIVSLQMHEAEAKTA